MLKTATIFGIAILSLGFVLGGCLASSAITSDDAESNPLNEEGSLAVREGIDKMEMDSGLLVEAEIAKKPVYNDTVSSYITKMYEESIQYQWGEDESIDWSKFQEQVDQYISETIDTYGFISDIYVRQDIERLHFLLNIAKYGEEEEAIQYSYRIIHDLNIAYNKEGSLEPYGYSSLFNMSNGSEEVDISHIDEYISHEEYLTQAVRDGE